MAPGAVMRKFFLTILLLAAGPALAQNPTTGPIGPRDYPGLATATDLVRQGIGGFPFADEWQAGGADPLTFGFVTALRVPAGAVTNPGQADFALAGDAQTLNPNRGAVGTYGEGGIMVTGGFAWGINGPTVNCENHSVSNCGLGKGFNFGALQNEFDTAIYKVGSAAPTGSAYGVVSIVAAEVQPTGALYAFDVSSAPVVVPRVPWKVAYGSEAGAATVGMTLLSALADPGSGDRSSVGQSINLYSRKTDGTNTFSTIIQDQVGNLFENNNAGATFGFMAAYPEWKMQHDNSGPTGLRIFNNSTNAGALSEVLLQTGSANSFLHMQVVESTHTADGLLRCPRFVHI
jgi:hypothetical protein